MGFLILGAWLSAPNGVSAQPKKYAVTGTVRNTEGRPIPNASACAFPVSQAGTAGSISWIRVSIDGNFRLVLCPGKYIVRAKSEADGYPDPNFLLATDAGSVFPEISIESSNVSGLAVTLGQRGGILEGIMLDKDTRAFISGKVVIRDAHKAEAFVEVSADSSGRFRFAVPTKPVLVVASAPGYQEQTYDGGRELTLSVGEERSIEIKLAHK